MALLDIAEIRARLSLNPEVTSGVPDALLQDELDASEAVIVDLYGPTPDRYDPALDTAQIAAAIRQIALRKSAQTDWISLDLRGLYDQKQASLRSNLGLPTNL